MTLEKTLKNGIKGMLPSRMVNYSRDLIDLSRIYPSYIWGKGKAPFPKSVTIDITFRCTCRCVMCALYGEHRDGWSNQEKDKELSTDEWLRVIDDLHAYGLQSICFTGGEPFLRKDLLTIIEYAKRKGLSVNVLTAGALLNREICSHLVEIGLDDLSVSIDGPINIHNAIRRSKVFEAAIEGIRHIQRKKELCGSQVPNITIANTIQKMNQEHLHELVPLAHELGVYLSYSPLFFTNNCSKKREQELDNACTAAKDENQGVLDSHRCVDVNILLKELNQVKTEAEALGQPVYVPFTRKSDIYLRYYDFNHSVLKKCFLPWYASRIDPFGNVYPCSVNVKCGNVRQAPFHKIWNNAKYQKFRNSLKKIGLFPGCAKCCVLSPEHKMWDILPCIGN